MRVFRAAKPADGGFTEYATAAAPRLRDTAYLMCRDWHLAEDLTQTALTKLYVAWESVSRAENIDAYARTVMLRTYLDHRRRRSSSELPSDALPDRGRSESSDLRLTLLDALSNLAPLDRAVVVLRYWEDYSVENTARTLRISQNSVKQRSGRSLAALRGIVASEAAPLRQTTR